MGKIEKIIREKKGENRRENGGERKKKLEKRGKNRRENGEKNGKISGNGEVKSRWNFGGKKWGKMRGK